MSSDEMGIIPARRLSSQDNTTTLNPQFLFQEDSPQLRFRGLGDSGSKTGFMGDRYFFPDLRRSGGFLYGEASEPRAPPSSEEDDEEEEEDEDDQESDGDGEIEGLVGVDNGGRNNDHSSGGGGDIGDRVSGAVYSKNHALFGSSTRMFITKDGGLFHPGEHANRVSSSVNSQEGRVGHLQKMVRIAEHDGQYGDIYYSQLIHGTEGSSQLQKDIAGDNGCGFSGRKNGSPCGDPGETLRRIFSDPITETLMDDAVILPCGHSFGGGGIQQVIKMKACYTCSHPVSEDSIAPNLSLRVAVQAFRREQDMHMYKASKRRRDRFEQDKGSYGDVSILESPRGRGVQFPFAVTDRVIIKGNKRTPQRFVGREAIVTTQCLNGWYVVKTLDNAECVKLQYRSLAKVSDNPASTKILLDHKITVSLLG